MPTEDSMHDFGPPTGDATGPYDSPDSGESRSCIHCGCTDEKKCDQGCSWILLDPPCCTTCITRDKITTDDLRVIADAFHVYMSSAMNFEKMLLEKQTQFNAMLLTLVALTVRAGNVPAHRVLPN